MFKLILEREKGMTLRWALYKSMFRTPRFFQIHGTDGPFNYQLMITLQLSWSSIFSINAFEHLTHKNKLSIVWNQLETRFKCSKRFQNLKMIFYLIKCRKPIQIGKVLSFMWFFILKPSQPRSFLTLTSTMFVSHFLSGSFEIKPTCIIITSTVKPLNSI